MHSLSRRTFLNLMGLSGAALTFPMVMRPSFAMAQSAATGLGKNVIVINLFGGLDGLAGFPLYTGAQVSHIANTLRPTIRVSADLVLPLGGQNGIASKIGFHPAFAPLVSRAAQHIKIVQGYGIPGDPGRSHDTCQILMSLGATQLQSGDMVGFLARLMDLQNWDSFQFWSFANENPSDTNTRKLPPLKVSDLNSFDIPHIGWESQGESESAWQFQEQLIELQVPKDDLSNRLASTTSIMRTTLASVRSDIAVQSVGANAAGDYSDSDLGRSLRDTMKLLKAKNERTTLPNYKKDMLVLAGQGGYDTHSDQNNPDGGSLTGLLTGLASNLAVFYEDLSRYNLLDDTVVIAYSEFGRTIYENGTAGSISVGTDHGHGSNTFVLGGPVSAGVVGAAPSISELSDQDFNALQPHIDFRNMFGDLLAWLGVNPEDIFTDPSFRYQPLGII